MVLRSIPIAIIILGLLISGISCIASPPSPPSSPTPTPSPAPAPTSPMPAPRPERYIKVEQTADKAAYLPGEEVVITLFFQNVNTEPLELAHFPPVAVEIVEKPRLGELIRALPPGEDIRVLAPGETITHTLTWDQRDDQGKPVEPGHYRTSLRYVYLDELPANVIMDIQGQALVILPPEGVVEKTIEINESKTVGGITFTLERVELTAAMNTVYAFTTARLPEPPPPHPGEPVSDRFFGAVAEYSIDGGVREKAGFSDGLSKWRVQEDGVRHTWYLLGFIPKGSKELTFIITRFGDVEGPWEFRVPLE